MVTSGNLNNVRRARVEAAYKGTQGADTCGSSLSALIAESRVRRGNLAEGNVILPGVELDLQRQGEADSLNPVGSDDLDKFPALRPVNWGVFEAAVAAYVKGQDKGFGNKGHNID